MSHYKITYFPIRGLAEQSRMVLAYANVPFEDVRINPADWPSLQPSTPFGKLPVLEVDGKPLAQSFAIARFLAKKYRLAGKDDWESAHLDAIADFIKDVGAEIFPYILVITGRSEGDKEELYKTVFKPALEKHLPVLEKILDESGSGFFVKSGVSWVDFHFASLNETQEGMAPEIMKNFPKLLAHKDKVYGLPQLKKYMENRQKTPV